MMSLRIAGLRHLHGVSESVARVVAGMIYGGDL